MPERVSVTPCLFCKKLTANLSKVCVNCLGRKFKKASKGRGYRVNMEADCDVSSLLTGLTQKAGGGKRIFRTPPAGRE